MRTPMRRSPSHCRSLGTICSACWEPGLAITPTVLMMGMEEELRISFGAEDGALHDFGFESELPHRVRDPITSGLVQLGLANDAALTDLAFTDFELRFDQYNHLPRGMETRNRP